AEGDGGTVASGMTSIHRRSSWAMAANETARALFGRPRFGPSLSCASPGPFLLSLRRSHANLLHHLSHLSFPPEIEARGSVPARNGAPARPLQHDTYIPTKEIHHVRHVSCFPAPFAKKVRAVP